METETKYTPGPWSIEEWQRDEKGLKLAILAPPDENGNNDYQIAVVSRIYNPSFKPGMFPDEANARLIAKAPLLEKCEDLLWKASIHVPEELRAQIAQLLVKLEE